MPSAGSKRSGTPAEAGAPRHPGTHINSPGARQLGESVGWPPSGVTVTMPLS